TVMPVLVVSEFTISPNRISPEWGFHRTIQVFFRHPIENVSRLTMASFGICPQLLNGAKRFEFGGDCRIFRVRTRGSLRRKPPEPGSLSEYFFLSIDMKNELFWTSHVRPGAKVQVPVAECRERAKSDPIDHVEVLQFRQNVRFVHTYSPFAPCWSMTSLECPDI